MARVRVVEIRNFQGIKVLTWYPAAGINCLIGPGDSGKSSILDAIDLCLGARRSIQFTDADFHLLDVESPIAIAVTLGELDDNLKNLDAYGMYVRGFNAVSGTIEDEPEKDAETVLTVRLTVASELEPTWTLGVGAGRSAGTDAEPELGRPHSTCPNPHRRDGRLPSGLAARLRAQPRLGGTSGCVGGLAKAARDARAAFGDQAQGQLGETLDIVAATAKELGIPIGENIKAMLDAHSVSFSGGTISLHDEEVCRCADWASVRRGCSLPASSGRQRRSPPSS